MADPCPITTHVLDTSSGMPASNLMIRLEKKDEASGEWHPLKTMRTNNDGRCPGFTQGHKLENCLYRITFETADYFRQQGKPCFYPEVVITFLVEYPEQHYHVPIILGPYGYSTYRGS
ncbi:unnamed protein product [Vitrella brassicaformis CCMP3155]|uniref:5-hydroxyisourate hydrolase n=1 Tax=Vitrella brassicaformis (strain CCMP3155) TaxID=1169540 RepID=A0A0G4GX49_VITBC|nr:unnamed protein product [Vitrella brassicaformis CCMP3155]|eukprot:CEM35627.1 unnamed protein product [Vitrella brassicaformis CCMP3155]